jgi:hypothetical protein
MQQVDVQSRSFRLSLPYLLSWAAAAHLSFVLILVLFAAVFGHSLDPVGLACLGVIPFFYWVALGAFFRLSVSAECLSWMNMNGRHCSVAWSDVERAEMANPLGLATLVVWKRGREEAYYITFCLANGEKFREAVREIVGDEHPVALAINRGNA